MHNHFSVLKIDRTVCIIFAEFLRHMKWHMMILWMPDADLGSEHTRILLTFNWIPGNTFFFALLWFTDNKKRGHYNGSEKYYLSRNKKCARNLRLTCARIWLHEMIFSPHLINAVSALRFVTDVIGTWFFSRVPSRCNASSIWSENLMLGELVDLTFSVWRYV